MQKFPLFPFGAEAKALWTLRFKEEGPSRETACTHWQTDGHTFQELFKHSAVQVFKVNGIRSLKR
jgi:hypothetical protein